MKVYFIINLMSNKSEMNLWLDIIAIDAINVG